MSDEGVAAATNGGPAIGGKRDRDEVFLEYTKSICPVCKVVVDAQVNVRLDFAVRSVAFQPVTHSGRHREFDPLRRLTNSEVIELIAAQRPDWLRTEDFFPVPCCFPTCRSTTYLLTEGTPGAPGFGVVPIPRLIQVADYLDYVSNRVVPDDAV